MKNKKKRCPVCGASLEKDTLKIKVIKKVKK